MPPFLKGKNRAETVIAAGSSINDTDDPCIFNVFDGNKLPLTPFAHTIDDEIFKCTSKTGSQLTSSRAQEGTIKAAHAEGAKVQARFTNKMYQDLIDYLGIIDENLTTHKEADPIDHPDNSIPPTKIKANSLGYFDRGDPASMDYVVGDFTTDETWRDLDLSSIVPAGAVAVHLYVQIKASSPGRLIQFRENGNVDVRNVSIIGTQTANIYNFADTVVSCDSNRIIEYWGSNVAFSVIVVTVRGWYKAK